MIEFPSIQAFVAHLEKTKSAVQFAAPVGVGAACDLVLDTARGLIGHYQREDTGPFDPWDELAPRTKDERTYLGFTPNDPLSRTGELRDSYERTVSGREGAVGSNLGKAVELELGLSGGEEYLPPRSVLGIAAFRQEESVVNLMCQPIAAALAGLKPMPGHVGGADLEGIPF